MPRPSTAFFWTALLRSGPVASLALVLAVGCPSGPSEGVPLGARCGYECGAVFCGRDPCAEGLRCEVENSPGPGHPYLGVCVRVCTKTAECGEGCLCNNGVCAVDDRVFCAGAPYSCTPRANTCGKPFACRRCDAPQTCGGGGTADQCGCTPKTCAALGKDCGLMQDGCGREINCGYCTNPRTCGTGGVPNVCGPCWAPGGRLCDGGLPPTEPDGGRDGGDEDAGSLDAGDGG